MKKTVLLISILTILFLLCGCSAEKTEEKYPEYFEPIVQETENMWEEKNSEANSLYMICSRLNGYDYGIENGGHEENGTFICYIQEDDEYYSFDMKEHITESDEWAWESIGVFREEENNRTYIVYVDFNQWGEIDRNPQLILIEFDTDNPENYQGTSYTVEPGGIVSDVGDCYRIGGSIYLGGIVHMSTEVGNIVINLETKELSYRSAEYAALKSYAQKIIDETEWEKPRSMSCFTAMSEKDGVMVYGAKISEGFDAPADILVFAAFKDGEPIAYMSVDLSEDELSEALETELIPTGHLELSNG